ncbi:hypothetical protein ACWDRR_08650 [Kitasatospora sp. NPDC003701]
MALLKKLSAGTIAAITSGTLLFSGAGVALAGDSGHTGNTAAPAARHTGPSTQPRADAAAIEAALRAVLLANPQLIGSPLCPETHSADDVGACLLRLQRLAPLILHQPDLLPRLSTGLILNLLAPAIACVLAGNDPALCPIAGPQGSAVTG